MEKNYDYRIVTFIDILGFKNLIYDSENDTNIRQVIFKALKFFKKWESPDRWGLKHIEIEEDAQYKGLPNFEIAKLTTCTCFSDSIVISVKINDLNINEIFSTLVANLADMGNYLMRNKILIRGAITIGNLYHNKNGIIFGSGLIEAYELESNNAIYPRIILSQNLISKLKYPFSDKNNRYPYHQYIDRFEDGCVGFHQMIVLQVIQNSSIISNDDLTNYLDIIRKRIIEGLDSNFENRNIFSKYNWLRNQYSKLIIFDDLKQAIRDVKEADSGLNIHFRYINRIEENETT